MPALDVASHSSWRQTHRSLRPRPATVPGAASRCGGWAGLSPRPSEPMSTNGRRSKSSGTRGFASTAFGTARTPSDYPRLWLKLPISCGVIRNTRSAVRRRGVRQDPDQHSSLAEIAARGAERVKDGPSGHRRSRRFASLRRSAPRATLASKRRMPLSAHHAAELTTQRYPDAPNPFAFIASCRAATMKASTRPCTRKTGPMIEEVVA